MVSAKFRKLIFFVVVALSLGYVIWNSPLTVDDLYYEAYGLRRVSDIFRFAIAYGNGRLLGNTLIHFILWSSSFRTILQTSVILLLWLITYKTVPTTKSCSFFVCIALFLAMSPSIVREVYLWSSAFANYVPGIVCMLLSLYLVRKSSEIGTKYIYIYIILFAISATGQLFVEHTSIINAAFAFLVLIYYIKTKATKKQIIASSVWLSGTLTGMSIMFLIPRLFYVANEWENYQKVNINSLHDFVISVVANGMQISGIYLQNVFALIILSIVLIVLANPKALAKAVLLFVPIYGFIVNYVISDLWSGTLCGMISLLLLVLYVITVVAVIIMETSIEEKSSILFFMGMSVFSVLPLLIVYPIGSRCLLHSYVFLVLAILSLIENNEKASLKFDRKMTAVSIVASCFLLCFLVMHFHQVGIIDQERLDYVQDLVEDGAEKITVPRIPSIYVKDNNGWSYGQVFYHEKKQDIKFEFIDYKAWDACIE